MKNRVEWISALVLCLAVAGAALAPYLLASRLDQPAVFNGFLINPMDGFSYLAKMRQGADGSWLFHLPYAPEPGPGTFVYVYYLFLGHVASWLGLSLLTIYHAARFLAAAVMFMLAFIFYKRTLSESRVTWIAFLLTLFGSGLGWLAIPFGIQASDLLIPESIPYLTAYTNAHFPLAAAAILGGVLSVLGNGRLGLRLLAAFICGNLLGAVLPFSVVSLGVTLLVWLAWELHSQGWRSGVASLWSNQRPRLLSTLALLVGTLPWLLYDLWLTWTHPVLAAWTAQNITPSPPLLNYILGYGLILILGIAGAAAIWPPRQPEGRLLLAWVVSNGILLYAPFSLQRRLTLGLFFPLAGLAALGLERLVRSRAWLRIVFVVVLILSVPSNLIVVSAGLSGVRIGEPAVVHLQDELDAYQWLGEHAPRQALVLAAPDTGNRLPVFADVRVLYGHPFETPDADTQKALVESIYAWDGSIEDGRRLLSNQGIDLIFYGQRERALGRPTWLEGLPLVFQSGNVEIYQAVIP